MMYHTVPISATGKVPSTAKAGCPVWQNTTCGNVQKEQAVKVSEIREEIMPENRICTLELAEVYVKAVESFMEDMEPEERTRENRPMYQRQNEEYIQGR